MKLIIGLGNPGPNYQATRHNLGFRVVDEVARRRKLNFKRGRGNALVAGTAKVGRVVLAKPQTYMNLSGEAAARLQQFYKVELADLLVVVDDIDLPLGQLRARARGSSGGHNGLRSVMHALGTEAFPRLRIGVGRNQERAAANYVLAPPEPVERQQIEEAIIRAADAVELFLSEGIDPVMNRYNRKPDARGEQNPPGAEGA